MVVVGFLIRRGAVRGTAGDVADLRVWSLRSWDAALELPRRPASVFICQVGACLGHSLID